MSRNKLYLLFLSLSLAGYSWIFWNSYRIQTDERTVSVCLFRTVTGIPCPSCGTTHSVLAIMKGDFYQAARMNPLGFIVLPALIIFPLWMILDLITSKNSFFNFYISMEKFIVRKWIACPVLLLFLVNWFINIYFHYRLR